MPMAIITGANRGLGFEFARQYLADGWQVIALVRSGSGPLDALAKSASLTIIEADLTSDDSLAAAVARIEASKIDLLINCAGMMGNGSFAAEGMAYQAFGTFNRDEWSRVFDINVSTPMALTELLADKLAAAEHGCVVTLSSMLGSNELNNAGNLYAYRASKAAVNSIMKSMGINLARRGVIAVALHPGWVQTDMGGPNADLSATESITQVRQTIANLKPKDSGRFLRYDGEAMPY